MAQLRRFGILDFLLLVLVLAAAAGARAGYLWTCADAARSPGPLAVQDPLPPLPGIPAGEQMLTKDQPTELDALVHNLKEHQWFGSLAPFAAQEEQTAHVSPGYPWLLSLLARVVDPADLPRMVRWIQCGLGALTAAIYFLFARRAFHSLFVGLLAGLLVAAHPFYVINTAAIDDGVLVAFLLALVLGLGARAVQTGGAFTSLLFGLTLAGLALTRAALLPFSFVAIGWFLLRSRSVSRGWLCAVLAFLGFANGLAPWAVRNYQIFKEPIPIVDSAHLHLWIGNHDKATGGPAPEGLLEQAPLSDLPKVAQQPERYAKLGQEWLKETQRDPLSTLKRRFQAALYFYFGASWFDPDRPTLAKQIGDETPPEWLEQSYPMILLGTLLGMLLFALQGWRWTYGWASEAMPSSLALIWVPLPYILSHAEALSGPRLPIDGILLCYAAFALACFLPGLGGSLLAGAREEPGDDLR